MGRIVSCLSCLSSDLMSPLSFYAIILLLVSLFYSLHSSEIIVCFSFGHCRVQRGLRSQI